MTHHRNYEAHRALAETSRLPLRGATPELRSPLTLPVSLVLRTLALAVLGLVVVKYL